ncbi:hypothetical protein JCM8547_004105 [Rhodosporidiobolus lusitaniae]
MGLFTKNKHTSPSGFFSADPDSDDETRAKHAAASSSSGRRRSSSAPRKSTDSAGGRRKSLSAEQHEAREGGLNKIQQKLVDADTPRGKAVEERNDGPVSQTPVRDGDRDHHSSSAAAVTAPLKDNRASFDGTTGDRERESAEANGAGNGHRASNIPITSSSGSSPTSHTSPTSSAATPASPRTSSLPVTSTAAAAPRASLDSTKEKLLPGQHGHHHLRGLTKDAVLSEEDAKRAEHDHQYLEPVVHERRHLHEVEEVERHRVVDRHVHHVQMHVQPLVDERHLEVVHSYREVPVSTISESHAATDADRALLARLNAQSASTYSVVPHDRVRIDKGETKVTENVIHHYHTIVQPVWQRDLHEFYRLSSDFSASTIVTPPREGGASLMGPPKARDGMKWVPDERGATHEVEFVNRMPVGSVALGAGEGLPTTSSSHSHTHIPATVSGDAPSAKEHYPSGAQGMAVREATGLTGAAGSHPQNGRIGGMANVGTTGVSEAQKGLEEMRLGVAQ